MLVGQAKALAEKWMAEYCRGAEVVGAVINGSAARLPDGDSLPLHSDVDINVLVAQQSPPKLGKFVYEGVLLDVSFIPLDAVTPAEKLLSTYELAGGFYRARVLADSGGQILALAKRVTRDFAKPYWVKRRCIGAAEKILRGTEGFDQAQPLLDNINPWLFPTGICTHLILVAALKNPTVRLRYAAVRPVLCGRGMGVLYGRLLDLLGNLGPQTALGHLKALEGIFDRAAACPRQGFPFAGDISPQARHIAIDATRTLIEAGDHREALFWLVVSFERCLRVLRDEAPEAYEEEWPKLLALLTDLGVESNGKLLGRIRETRALLPQLAAAADSLIAGQEEG